MSGMTQSADAHLDAEARHRGRTGATVAMIAGAASLAVVLLTVLDRVQVQSQGQLARVAFGKPLAWVTQNQTLDPPMPHSATFLSPWAHPTTIQVLPLAIDVALVGVVLTAVWCAVRGLRSRHSPQWRARVAGKPVC